MSGNADVIRIQLVDDHIVVRSGLRLLVAQDPCFEVVAEAGSAVEAVEAAARHQPDIVLLDLALGRDSGLDCIPAIREAAPGARVLVLTGVRDTEVHQQAVRVGASGVLLKEQAPELLMKAIARVHAGETWLDRTTTASLLAELSNPAPRRKDTADPEQARLGALTDREREVIALLAEGLRNQPIAERLRISEATVRHHLTSIFKKLEVPDRLALIIYAFRHGLARPELPPNEGPTAPNGWPDR